MPNYSRSHLGRFIRKMFAQEIERELRMLEEYVIEDADPTKVGENLIADALGENAPYTKFTAAIEGSEARASRPATSRASKSGSRPICTPSRRAS